MKNCISNSQKSLTILNQLIEDGYYSGEISKNGFDLIGYSSKSMYRIVGTVEDDKRFVIHAESKWWSKKQENAQALVILVIFWLLLAFSNRTTGVLIAQIIIPISYVIYRSIRGIFEQKEIDIFTDKYIKRKQRLSK